MDMTHERARAIFMDHDLPHLAELQQFFITNKPLEFGSSSINPKYAKGAVEVIAKLYDAFNIFPRGMGSMAALRSMGDPSGMFYFGGLRHISDGQKPETIATTEYMLYLAAVTDTLTDEAQTMLNDFAKGCVSCLTAVATEVHSFDDWPRSKH